MEVIWSDRKRYFGLPISFTKYTLSENRLFLDKGLFTTVSDEVQLYRIRDLKLVRTFWDKIFGVGDVIVYSTDKNMPEFHIHKIKHPKEVKEKLYEQTQKDRIKNGVRSSELMQTVESGIDTDGDEIPDDGCNDISDDLLH